MKGATVVCWDSRFLVRAGQILRDLGYGLVADEQFLQLREGGRLFTMYPDGESLKYLTEDLDPMEYPELFRDDARDFQVECRWEEQFCRIVRSLAEGTEGKLIVIDGDSVVWDARSLDPERISL